MNVLVSAVDLGPAMQALNPMQRAFVIGKVLAGLTDVEAARQAGYVDPHANATRVAHTLVVQDAILEQSRALMRSQGPKSIHCLVEIRDDKTNNAKDRMKASVELLNRSGFHQISEHHVHEHRHASDAEADRRILALAAELGLSPDQAKLMLVAPADFEQNAEGVYEIPPQPPSETQQAVSERKIYARRRGMTPEQVAADKLAVRRERAERLRAEQPPRSDSPTAAYKRQLRARKFEPAPTVTDAVEVSPDPDNEKLW